MSWDVLIINLSGKTPPSMEEFNEDDFEPLGSATEVRQQIASQLCGVDWSDPTWGLYENEDYSIEFNAGQDDPIQNIMLHVRGGGDAIAAIIRFTKPLSWSVLDCSTGKFLDLENPSTEGWEGFQAFRDKVVTQNTERGDNVLIQKPWWKFW